MAAAIRSFSSIRRFITAWRRFVPGRLRTRASTLETAARFAGRTLSFAGWMATLAGAFVLARIPSAPRIAGLVGRPSGRGDTGLRRAAVRGASRHARRRASDLGRRPRFSPRCSRNGPPDKLKILLAFAFFALAGCIKQHLVVTPGVAFCLLIGARTPGRPGWKTIAGALLLEAIILLSYYGFEEWVTAGRMSRSMLAATEASAIHPSTWQNAGGFPCWCSCWKCVGLILVLAAAAVAAISRREGRWRRVLTTTGAALDRPGGGA